MSFKDNDLYDPLLDEDAKLEEESDNGSLSISNSSRPNVVKRLAVVVVAISAIFATVFTAVGAAIARHNHTSAPGLQVPQPEYVSCGGTPEEARSRGCTFDIISFSWLTPECYDGSLTEEFVSWENWVWYTNEAQNETMSLQQAMLGEQDALVDWHYHVVHCTFMWRQMHRGIERGFMGHHLRSYDHTVHCQHTFLQDPDASQDILTPARVIYPQCLRVGTEDGMYPGPMSSTGLA